MNLTKGLNRTTILAACLLLTAAAFTSCRCASPNGASNAATQEFSFALTADVREFTGPKHPGPHYFEGACAALRDLGPGDFMISAGDIDPPAAIRATLDRFFGSNYVWYPVVGNHEAQTPDDMTWLRAWGGQPIPGLVRRGPAGSETTTYSFDHGPAHFVVLNQYYDGQSDIGSRGDVVDPLYQWLQADLEANRKPVVFVVGHEPLVPTRDMDNGRLRHKGDSLDAYPANARRFLDLMRQHRVTAYLTAHSHNTSVTNLGGVWQIDAGHARGLGDKGARSSFLKLRVHPSGCRVDIYRDDGKGGAYELTRSVKLDGLSR
jgi:hypothetical protein